MRAGTFVGRVTSLVPDRLGAISVLFALMLPMLIGFLGLGFDAVRGMLVQQRLQKALDAASLAASATLGNDTQRQTIAENVFAANYGSGFLAPAANLAVAFGSEGEVTIDATANIRTLFMRLFETETLAVGSSSQSMRPLIDLEVALVVDISGSMAQAGGQGLTRMAALRAAAHDLVDILEDSKPPGTRLRFAIIPYNVNVNIGTGNAGFVDGTSHTLFAGTSWAGCVMARQPPHHIDDVYDSLASDGSGKWHAYIWPPEPNMPAGDCNNPSDGGNGGYATVEESVSGPDEVWTMGPNFNCTRQSMLPLTEDLAVVRSEIDGLHHAWNKGTVIAPGVTWGLRALSPQEPFTEGSVYSPGTRKIMIVLTDGQQINDGAMSSCTSASNSGTAYAFDPATFGLSGDPLSTGPGDIWTAYGYVEDSQPFAGLAGYAGLGITAQFDRLLIDACAEVKSAGAGTGGGVQVFAVTFGSGANAGSSVAAAMEACASSSSQYYHAPNSASLRNTFEEIGRQVSKVRLTG